MRFAAKASGHKWPSYMKNRRFMWA